MAQRLSSIVRWSPYGWSRGRWTLHGHLAARQFDQYGANTCRGRRANDQDRMRVDARSGSSACLRAASSDSCVPCANRPTAHDGKHADTRSTRLSCQPPSIEDDVGWFLIRSARGFNVTNAGSCGAQPVRRTVSCSAQSGSNIAPGKITSHPRPEKAACCLR